MRKPLSLFGRIKRALYAATQVVLSAPLKLPRKVVAGARYVALLIGLLDALDTDKREQPGKEDLHE